MEKVSAQHNQQEKDTQQHVANVAEDVVESTAEKQKSHIIFLSLELSI